MVFPRFSTDDKVSSRIVRAFVKVVQVLISEVVENTERRSSHHEDLWRAFVEPYISYGTL